jgi:glutathione S-transferase
MRKIDGGLRALASWVEQSKNGYLVQSRLTYADIAVCSVLGFMNVRWPQHSWVRFKTIGHCVGACADKIAVNLSPNPLSSIKRLRYSHITDIIPLGRTSERTAAQLTISPNRKEQYPHMEKYFKALDERPSFANTRPSPQKFSDPVV